MHKPCQDIFGVFVLVRTANVSLRHNGLHFIKELFTHDRRYRSFITHLVKMLKQYAMFFTFTTFTVVDIDTAEFFVFKERVQRRTREGFTIPCIVALCCQLINNLLIALSAWKSWKTFASRQGLHRDSARIAYSPTVSRMVVAHLRYHLFQHYGFHCA